MAADLRAAGIACSEKIVPADERAMAVREEGDCNVAGQRLGLYTFKDKQRC